MKDKKRMILVLAISLLVAAFAGIGVVATLGRLVPLKVALPIRIESSSPASADMLKSQAYTALKNALPAKAKTLFEQAKIEYKTSNNVSAVAEIDGQLYLIDHTRTPTQAPSTVIKTN